MTSHISSKKTTILEFKNYFSVNRFFKVDLYIFNTIINNNIANIGGGLYINAFEDYHYFEVFINNSIINNNYANTEGGGIHITQLNSYNKFNFYNTTIKNNSCNSLGGGLYSQYGYI